MRPPSLIGTRGITASRSTGELYHVNVIDYEAFFLVFVNDHNVCFTFFRVNVFTSVSLSGKRYGSADRIIAVTYIQTVLM